MVRDTIRALNKCAVYFSAVLLGIMLLLIVLEIFLRNVFFVFIPGVFELTQVFLSVCFFMAVAYANDKREHVVTEVLYKRLPKSAKWILSLISSLLFLIITGVLGWFVLQFALGQFGTGEHTMRLSIALWPFAIFGTIGLLLLCLSVVTDLVCIIKDREVLSVDSN